MLTAYLSNRRGDKYGVCNMRKTKKAGYLTTALQPVNERLTNPIKKPARYVQAFYR